MFSIDYLIYGSKRLLSKPILEIIHFGYYNIKLIPIHAYNKLILKRRGNLEISDYQFATKILNLNSSNDFDIYKSVYQRIVLKKNYFFFDPKSVSLKENYLSNYTKQAEETIEYANKYLKHEFNFLGRKIKFDDKVDYHYGFEQNLTSDKYFLDANYFLPHWDIKPTWELNRQQHLQILGKAYFISNDEKYAKEVCSQIEQWIDQNPYLLGVNWTEGIEAAVRTYSWIFAYEYVIYSKPLTPEANFKILKYIYLHGKFIRTFLSDKWNINGNHLLAELSGLLLIGISFPEFKESKEWISFALQKLESELNTQVLDDGAIWEHSTGYQRFVTEMVLYPVILLIKNEVKIPETILLKLEKMLDFIDSISMSNGKIPLVGDEDQGYMLNLNFSQYDDIKDILSCGTVLFNEKYSSFKSELVFWLFNGLVLLQNEMIGKKQNFKVFKDSGYCLFKSPNDYLLLVTNAQNQKYSHAAHRHLDMLSFVYELEGEYFIVDNGTYIYNGDKYNRDLFRSTCMHNTLTVDKNNPCSFGPFELKPCPHAKITKYGEIENCFFVKALHDWNGSLRHNKIIVQINGGYLIFDSVECNNSHCYESYIHLHPEVQIKVVDDFNLIISQNNIYVYINSLERIKIVESAYSPKYGTLMCSKSLKISTNCATYKNLIKISTNSNINESDHILLNKIMST